jgi:hypothetical protein
MKFFLPLRVCCLAMLLKGFLCLPVAHASDASQMRLMWLDLFTVEPSRVWALRRLAWAVSERTNLNPSMETGIQPLTPELLYEHPFYFVDLPARRQDLDISRLRLLRRYLHRGGMLAMNAGQQGASLSEQRSLFEELAANLLPGAAIVPLHADHVLFYSFYLLKGVTGHTGEDLEPLAVEQDGRVLLLFMPGDPVSAWARDHTGSWMVPMEAARRERAFRFGVNLLMYSVCLDYKDDLVHLDVILRRRR